MNTLSRATREPRGSSARRPPAAGHERSLPGLSDSAMLAGDYIPPELEPRANRSPELELAAAVFRQAWLDILSCDKTLAAEAKDWFTSRDTRSGSQMYTFALVCEIFGLDVGAVRKRLPRTRKDGWFMREAYGRRGRAGGAGIGGQRRSA